MTEPEGYQRFDSGDVPRPLRAGSHATAVVDNEYFIRAAFAESSEKGFEALFRLYYNPLCSHALRFVYTREVAEDIVSEIFYQLWKTDANRSVQFTYRTYLYAAVRHRAYNYLRDELTGNRAPASIDELEYAGAEESPQTLVEYDETFQRLEKVIKELPSQCQRVFLMSRFENRKNLEIATELGIALKTVEAHLSRALSQIRRAILTMVCLLFVGLH
ncbi:RNA polymerase sigma-70 factor [Spirosoma aerolatum]|uniref:RNA polymerase sigma-70 factor n=1 Tax=Spirosoma aerolatum TaxID=1211326 RepID=UPI0009ADFB80|nr:RNA polymerase sigma-70 factor [Spirosoma aerolatum]